MNNIKTLFFFFFLFLIIENDALADLNTAFTIFSAKVEGLNRAGYSEIRKEVFSHLREKGINTNSKDPFARYLFLVGKGKVGLKVTNYKTGTIVFDINFAIEKYTPSNVKEALKELINSFDKKLPFDGTLYALSSDRVKINIGDVRGVKQGDILDVIRFRGSAPSEIDLGKDSPYKKVGKVKVLKAKDNSSLAVILEDNGINKFDKVLFSNQKKIVFSKTKEENFLPLENDDQKNRKFSFFVGFNSVSLKTKPKEDLSQYPIIPDVDKKLTLASIVPQLGFEYLFSYKFEADFDILYRKIPLTLQSGEELKATFMLFSLDIKYWIRQNASDRNSYALTFGYFMYYNTVNKELIRYISSKYLGPQIGGRFQKFYNSSSLFFDLKIYPYLIALEDMVKRGQKASAFGYLIKGGYAYGLNKYFNPSIEVFYRELHTSFSGSTTHDISPENLKYSESQFGINVNFKIYF